MLYRVLVSWEDYSIALQTWHGCTCLPEGGSHTTWRWLTPKLYPQWSDLLILWKAAYNSHVSGSHHHSVNPLLWKDHG